MLEQSFDADIIVAGAGPSGLVTSCEAALGGARVLTFDKRNGPTWSRAGNLTSRVMELFASRGLAKRILDRAFELHTEPRSYEGIWAGMPGLDYTKTDTDFPYVLFLSQIEIEQMLMAHLQTLGGDLRLRHEVTGFEQDADGVTVHVLNGDSERLTFRTKYLVGADGGRSTVRQAAGIAFEGEPSRRHAVNVDAYIANPYEKVSNFFHSTAGWAMSYPLSDSVTRLAFIDAQTCATPRTEAPSLEEAKQMLRRVHGSDFGITEVKAITHFSDAMRIAEKVREGRVILVGESVRIHYPASGVGMNFCIQDAFNLGWKLAAVATDRAAPGLLETYEAERGPIVAAFMDDVRRQCAIQFNFDEEHAALKRFIEHDLIPMPEVNQKLCTNLSGIGARYKAAEDAHPLTGRRMPNVAIKADDHAASLFDLLVLQDFVLLQFGEPAAFTAPARLPIRLATAHDTKARDSLAGVASVLVRPDGYVAWASERPLSEYFPLAEIGQWLNVAQASQH